MVVLEGCVYFSQFLNVMFKFVEYRWFGLSCVIYFLVFMIEASSLEGQFLIYLNNFIIEKFCREYQGGTDFFIKWVDIGLVY